MVSGAICGYHVLKRGFVFGEYQTSAFLDALENVTWKSSVQLKEILPCIRDVLETRLGDLNETSCYSEQKRIEARLYQEVTRWVLKNNHFLALKLPDEFLKFAEKEMIKVKMIVQ